MNEENEEKVSSNINQKPLSESLFEGAILKLKTSPQVHNVRRVVSMFKSACFFGEGDVVSTIAFSIPTLSLFKQVVSTTLSTLPTLLTETMALETNVMENDKWTQILSSFLSSSLHLASSSSSLILPSIYPLLSSPTLLTLSTSPSSLQKVVKRVLRWLVNDWGSPSSSSGDILGSILQQLSNLISSSSNHQETNPHSILATQIMKVDEFTSFY